MVVIPDSFDERSGVPGETLSGIAGANGLSTETLAAWNGVGADSYVISGSSIMVPTVDQIGYQYGWGKYEAPDEWWHVSYRG